MAIRAKLCRTGMHLHRIDLASDLLTGCVHDPDIAKLQISNITIFKIHNLIGRAGQRQGIRGQKVFVLSAANH